MLVIFFVLILVKDSLTINLIFKKNQFELPKTAILNKKFYHSINEVRYFLKEDLLNNRLHLLDILNNSYKKYVNFEGNFN